jgi:hypothetical protein
VTAPSDLDHLEQRLADLERQLGRLAGDASLCAISKSGGQVDGAKYLEGRMVAVLEVRRAVRRGGDLAAQAAAALEDWTSELDAARARALGRGWIAYRAGGVDELTELVHGRTDDAPS